jgi:tetrahydromethanopterin S-methyltransferase subunit G
MKIPTPAYRCPLGRIQPEPADLDAIKQRGWRDQHILVVNAADERLDFIERELVQRIGERLYGGKP